MRIKDIRRQTFLAFLVYSTISLMVASLSFWLFQRKVEIEHFSDTVSKLFTNTLGVAELGHYFLVYETKKDNYYKTDGKTYLTKQETMIDSIKHYINLITKNRVEEKFGIKTSINGLLPLHEKYTFIFRQIVLLTSQRGALQHRLRVRAAELEKRAQDLKWEILTLRTYERDYFIQQDSAFIVRFDGLSDQLEGQLAKSTNPASQELLVALQSYRNDFRKLVRVDNEIGLGRDTGLNAKLKNINQRISDLANKISTESNRVKDEITEQIINVFLAVIVISVIMILILAMLFKFITDTDKKIPKLFKL